MKRLPALAATEGQRKAWKLEAQSSLTVPMLRRSRSDGAGRSRQRPGRCRMAEQQARRCRCLRAGCRQGSRRTPRSGWSRGRRLWQGSSSGRSPRASPSQSPPLPACTPARSLPAHQPALLPMLRTAAQSHLEDKEFGNSPAAPPPQVACPPAAPLPPRGAGSGVFLEQFYPSVLEH